MSLLEGAVEYVVSATRFGWTGEWENAIPYSGSMSQSHSIFTERGFEKTGGKGREDGRTLRIVMLHRYRHRSGHSEPVV